MGAPDCRPATPCASSTSRATRPSTSSCTTPMTRRSATARPTRSSSRETSSSSTGSRLMSNEGRPLMTVTATTCARHDTIGGACSQESNTLRYGFHTKQQHACVENFLLALSEHDMGKRDMTSNVNWFMNVPGRARRHARDRRRHLGRRALGRSARGDGRARGHLELPADQQPVQRVQPDSRSRRRLPLTCAGS